MLVRVHKNLNKKCWSIHTYQKGKGWRLYRSVSCLWLEFVTFKVSKAGNKRTRRQKRKNVHAFAYGSLLACNDIQNSISQLNNHLDSLVDWHWSKAKYDPYKHKTFVSNNIPNKWSKLVESEQAVFLDNGELWCLMR